MNFKKYPKEAAVQFIRFGVVGLSNTALSYLINIVTLKLWSHFPWNGITFLPIWLPSLSAYSGPSIGILALFFTDSTRVKSLP